MSHIKVESFNSPEEMEQWFAEQREARAGVQQRVLAPEQEALTFGSHAVRFWDGDLVIFVEVPTLEEQAKIEDPEVVDHVKTKERDEGMLWTKSYSVDCVDGEYGWHHRSTLWPISKDTLDRARAVHWSIERLWPASGEATLEVQSAFYDLRNWVREHPDQSEATSG